MVLAAHSDTGICFYVADVSAPGNNAGTYYASASNGVCNPALAGPTGTVSLPHVDGNSANWALAY